MQVKWAEKDIFFSLQILKVDGGSTTRSTTKIEKNVEIFFEVDTYGSTPTFFFLIKVNMQ